jgi:hypothetical protein
MKHQFLLGDIFLDCAIIVAALILALYVLQLIQLLSRRLHVAQAMFAHAVLDSNAFCNACSHATFQQVMGTYDMFVIVRALSSFCIPVSNFFASDV